MQLSKKERIGLWILALLLLIGMSVIFFINRSKDEVPVIEKAVVTSQPVTKDEVNTKIKVYICGEIHKSGVYTLEESSRLETLVELAGGLTDKADPVALNLAQKLSDGQKVVVPEKGKVLNNQKDVANDSQGDGKVNINTASLSKLDSLPGIGPVLAQRIIDYRDKNGAFKSVKDIDKVSGIGEKLYNDIKDKICV